MVILKYLVPILLIKQCLCDEIIEVNLKQGVLMGKVEKTLYMKQDYYSFKGIPFAEVPTGNLRFQPPKPHLGWEDKLETFDNKPTCMQFNTRHRIREPTGISGSEDCLYINVFTPNVEGNAPVLVFDYNDNFRTGFNGSDTYTTDFFMEEGVLIVTIGNRLGVFGYLTTEDNVIPGNNGLRDFILGLEWIKDNIEQFGGDPSKVTLMGSRGGAAIVDILLYSRKAKNLFSGVILQSGTSLEALYFYGHSRTKAFQLAESLNITASNSHELLKRLQDLQDVEKIFQAEFKILVDLGDEYQPPRFPFTPCVEHDTKDAILTVLPDDGNIVNDVPVIIGFNSREGLDLISHILIEPRILKNDYENTLLTLPRRTNFKFEQGSAKYKRANRAIVDFYFTDKSLHYGSVLEHAVFVGDSLQNYALDLAAEKLSQSLSSSVFYYLFDFLGHWNENSSYLSSRAVIKLENHGATIIDDLCYLFVCARIKQKYEYIINLASEQPEFKVLKRMIRLWSNFAKTGNPTPSKDDSILKNFIWEPFNKNTGRYLHVSKHLKVKSNPLGERRKFWDDFIEKYSQEAIDGVVRDEEDQMLAEEYSVDVPENVDEEQKEFTENYSEDIIDSVVVDPANRVIIVESPSDDTLQNKEEDAHLVDKNHEDQVLTQDSFVDIAVNTDKEKDVTDDTVKAQENKELVEEILVAVPDFTSEKIVHVEL